VIEVIRSRGRVSDRRIAVFAIAMKTLSNYTNHITETPVDSEFAEQIWPGALAWSSKI
jgi:hypothetical protein